MGEGAALFGVRSIPDKPDERVFTRCTLERCERAAGEGESDVTVHAALQNEASRCLAAEKHMTFRLHGHWQ